MNKRNLETLNLRDAYPEMPQECRDALLFAARSVQEEKKMKKFTFRTLALTAALLLLTAAAALAAADALGWTDFFRIHYSDTRLPEAAQRVLGEQWNRHTFPLGPLTYTTHELYCDGHIAMASTEIRLADGGRALLAGDPSDPIGANGENGAALASRLGVAPETTWLEAAKQLKLPLYRVRAILEAPPALDGGEAWEDALWNEDGGMTYFSVPSLNGQAQGEKAAFQLYLYAAEMDPATGEEKTTLRSRENLDIFLEAPLAFCDYAPETGADLGGFALTSVHGELMPAGLYLTSTYTAPDSATRDQAIETLYQAEWLDENGTPLPWGVILGGGVELESWPQVSMTQMLAADALPDTLILRVGSQEITVRQTK